MVKTTGTENPEFIEGTVNNDTLRGGGGNSTLYGDAGDDRLYGDDGSDALIGAIGKDTPDGESGAGSDTLTGCARDVSLDGGLGADLLLELSRSHTDTVDNVGDVPTNRAAVAVGSAGGNYADGARRIFVVDNGTDSPAYPFTASKADARVSAAEVTLPAMLQGTASLATADIEFGG